MNILKRNLLYLILLLFLDLPAQEVIHFEYYQRLIFVQIQVNQTDSLLFLLDTGANGSAIDSKTSDRLNLKEFKVDTVEGSAGKIIVPSVIASSVSIGKSMINNISFTKYDLSGSLSMPDKKLDGILGTDFLKHFVITLDFNNKLFSISKQIPKNIGFGLAFEMDNGIPRIKTILNDSVSIYLRYDSGASLFETKDVYLNVTTQQFNKIIKTEDGLKPVSYLSGTGVGGAIQLPVYTIRSMNFDKIKIKNLYLIVQPEQGYFARPDAVGFFGNNLIEKFSSITLDFIHKYIYIKQFKFD